MEHGCCLRGRLHTFFAQMNGDGVHVLSCQAAKEVDQARKSVWSDVSNYFNLKPGDDDGT